MAARSSETDLGISRPFLAQFSNFLCPWHSEFRARSDYDLCGRIGRGRGHSWRRGRPKLTFEFLGHFWPDFQTFCVLGTQKIKVNLILTFVDGLVEVEATRIREVVPN